MCNRWALKKAEFVFLNKSCEDSVIASKLITINWSVWYYKVWYFPLQFSCSAPTV